MYGEKGPEAEIIKSAGAACAVQAERNSGVGPGFGRADASGSVFEPLNEPGRCGDTQTPDINQETVLKESSWRID